MSYNTLMDYSSYAAGTCQSIKAPYSAMAIQVVPVYSPPGYDGLTHGPCAFDHLNISQAYPSNCDKFTQRLCDCNCGDPTVTMKPPMAPPMPAVPTGMSQNVYEGYRSTSLRRR